MRDHHWNRGGGWVIQGKEYRMYNRMFKAWKRREKETIHPETDISSEGESKKMLELFFYISTEWLPHQVFHWVCHAWTLPWLSFHREISCKRKVVIPVEQKILRETSLFLWRRCLFLSLGVFDTESLNRVQWTTREISPEKYSKNVDCFSNLQSQMSHSTERLDWDTKAWTTLQSKNRRKLRKRPLNLLVTQKQLTCLLLMVCIADIQLSSTRDTKNRWISISLMGDWPGNDTSYLFLPNISTNMPSIKICIMNLAATEVNVILRHLDVYLDSWWAFLWVCWIWKTHNCFLTGGSSSYLMTDLSPVR